MIKLPARCFRLGANFLLKSGRVKVKKSKYNEKAYQFDALILEREPRNDDSKGFTFNVSRNGDKKTVLFVSSFLLIDSGHLWARSSEGHDHTARQRGVRPQSYTSPRLVASSD